MHQPSLNYLIILSYHPNLFLLVINRAKTKLWDQLTSELKDIAHSIWSLKFKSNEFTILSSKANRL